MLFNSHVFLLAFLPITLAVWWGLREPQLRLAALTVASYVFYAWAKPSYVAILVSITLVDYVAGRRIGAAPPERRRGWLAATVVVNLALLGWFKYAGFFAHALDDLGRRLGEPGLVPAISVALPIGISFYVLNSLSYVFDVARGRLEPEHNLVRYAAFVAMFPHLIAGPIVRFADIGPQLRALRPRLTAELAAGGLTLLAVGLFKKLVIADTLAHHVDPLYLRTSFGLLSGWAAAVGYTLQLYFDFSGYSDMAIGLAMLLGIQFPRNFDAPLRAHDISDFWRRWHITLGAWMRDYLYIPLGGSRRGPRIQMRNLIATFAIVGLWHGAAYTFVVWGLFHGILIAGHATLRRLRPGRRLPDWIARPITFAAFATSLVVFRSIDLTAAGHVLRGMVGLGGISGVGGPQLGLPFACEILGALLIVNLVPSDWKLRVAGSRRVTAGVAVGMAAGISIIFLSQSSPFLYFKF